jgi:protein-S-isoprenylcysteine O-methyltransferase Ste14
MFHWFLVVAQFVLGACLVLSATWSPLPWLRLLLAGPGIALAIWAWFRIGLRKVRIHPTVTESTVWVSAGPYGVVRHPMYTGLLWFTAALLFDPWRWWRLAGWIALLLVLYVKSVCEEQSMSTQFPDYESYRQRVGRLLPNPRGLLPK